MHAESENDRLETLDAAQQGEGQANKIPPRVWIAGNNE
jgi:hypothetical protein